MGAAAAGGIPTAGLALAALPLAASIYGPFSQPTTMDAKFWNGLGAGLSPVQNQAYTPNDMQLAALMASAGNDVPPWLIQLAKQDGISALPAGPGAGNKFAGSNNFVQKA